MSGKYCCCFLIQPQVKFDWTNTIEYWLVNFRKDVNGTRHEDNVWKHVQKLCVITNTLFLTGISVTTVIQVQSVYFFKKFCWLFSFWCIVNVWVLIAKKLLASPFISSVWVNILKKRLINHFAFFWKSTHTSLSCVKCPEVGGLRAGFCRTTQRMDSVCIYIPVLSGLSFSLYYWICRIC